MPITQKALDNDKSLGVPLIKLTEIWADEEFNCRAWFSPSTCIPLANDIGSRGLQQPIVVRGLRPKPDQGLPGEEGLIEKGFRYKLIAGFRRKTAYGILKAEQIPAIVKNAYMSDFDCRDINAIENLQRTNLNLWEECRAIRHYWNAGWTFQEIADRVSQSTSWVDVRIKLLELPQEVQAMAATGHIIQADIRELYKYRHERENLLRSAAKLRDLRAKGVGRNITRLIAKKSKPSDKKLRKRSEIFELMNLIRELCKAADKEQNVVIGNMLSNSGNSIITRVLGWASGEVTTGEMYQSLTEFCAVIDVHFDSEQYMDQSVEFVR